MKLETLRKQSKKKIIIGGVILLSIVAVVTFTSTRAKYRSTQSLKIASGTVNFKTADLNVVAINVSEDGTNYIDQNEIPTGAYNLNTEKSKCRISTETLTGENAPVDNTIPIEYRDGRVYIGVNKKNTKCYLYFDKINLPTSSTIIADIKARTDGSYKGTTTPTWTSVATGAETAANNGIYETDDPMYGTGKKTYYWRGAATTNHVIFANKCWRIVRINGDGTMRLIYNGSVQSGNTCKGNGSNADSIAKTSVKYNTSYNNSAYVGWTYTASSRRPSSTTSGTAAPIKTTLETWFNDNSNFTDTQRAQVAEGYYCNDRTTKSGDTWSATGSTFYFAAYRRLCEGTYTPSLECDTGDRYKLKVGLITADEVQFAGAKGSTSNTSYYLYNGQYYWTMSPYYWSGSGASVFRVYDTNGFLDYGFVNDTLGLRPVINLNADTTFNLESDGTQDNPYIVQ